MGYLWFHKIIVTPRKTKFLPDNTITRKKYMILKKQDKSHIPHYQNFLSPLGFYWFSLSLCVFLFFLKKNWLRFPKVKNLTWVYFVHQAIDFMSWHLFLQLESYLDINAGLICIFISVSVLSTNEFFNTFL